MIVVHHFDNSRSRRILERHDAEGSAVSPLLLKRMFQTLPERMPRLLRPFLRDIAQKTQDSFIDPQLKTHADLWEAELEDHEWFCGDSFIVADSVTSFPLEAAWSRAGIRGKYPEIGHFLHRIYNRPAYKRALKRRRLRLRSRLRTSGFSGALDRSGVFCLTQSGWLQAGGVSGRSDLGHEHARAHASIDFR